jgi:hypothetical protein
MRLKAQLGNVPQRHAKAREGRTKQKNPVLCAPCGLNSLFGFQSRPFQRGCSTTNRVLEQPHARRHFSSMDLFNNPVGCFIRLADVANFLQKSATSAVF